MTALPLTQLAVAVTVRVCADAVPATNAWKPIANTPIRNCHAFRLNISSPDPSGTKFYRLSPKPVLTGSKAMISWAISLPRSQQPGDRKGKEEFIGIYIIKNKQCRRVWETWARQFTDVPIPSDQYFSRLMSDARLGRF